MNSLDGVNVIELERKGQMGMPLDIEVTMTDGTKKMFYIPLQEMRGEKEIPSNWTKLADWSWANPTYNLILDGINMNDVKSVTIDPLNQMADIDKENNSWSLEM